MIIKSYAKINLSLKVISKLKEGLHQIQSIYCLIDLYDEIKIKENRKKRDKISFKGPFAKFVKKNNNSITQLLSVLRKLKLIKIYYSIEISKRIPVFGGLGGGTSNAAFILRFLIKKKINNNLLNKLVSKIGSDLRLFFTKQGILKDLKSTVSLEKKQKLFFILVQPKERCSTKEIYAKVQKYSKKEDFRQSRNLSKSKFLNYLSKNRNDLQFVVEKKYPIIKKLLLDLKNMKGCCFSRMTGSGSVCYGLFKDQSEAKRGLNKLKIKYPKFWHTLAKTV